MSGALRSAGKADRDPFFPRQGAGPRASVCPHGQRLGLSLYFIENPVGVLSTLWRKPDFSFHPFEYGGYLDPATEYQHPLFPHSIAPLDAYKKLTCLWAGGGFTMPALRPVEAVRSKGPLRDRWLRQAGNHPEQR